MFPRCLFHQTPFQSNCYDTVRKINTLAVEFEKKLVIFRTQFAKKSHMIPKGVFELSVFIMEYLKANEGDAAGI